MVITGDGNKCTGAATAEDSGAAVMPALFTKAAGSTTASFDQQQSQNELPDMIPLSTPTAKLLPVRMSHAITSSQRMQYLTGCGASKSDVQDDFVTCGSACASDTDGVVNEDSIEQATAPVAAAVTTFSAGPLSLVVAEGNSAKSLAAAIADTPAPDANGTQRLSPDGVAMLAGPGTVPPSSLPPDTMALTVEQQTEIIAGAGASTIVAAPSGAGASPVEYNQTSKDGGALSSSSSTSSLTRRRRSRVGEAAAVHSTAQHASPRQSDNQPQKEASQSMLEPAACQVEASPATGQNLEATSLVDGGGNELLGHSSRKVASGAFIASGSANLRTAAAAAAVAQVQPLQQQQHHQQQHQQQVTAGGPAAAPWVAASAPSQAEGASMNPAAAAVAPAGSILNDVPRLRAIRTTTDAAFGAAGAPAAGVAGAGTRRCRAASPAEGAAVLAASTPRDSSISHAPSVMTLMYSKPVCGDVLSLHIKRTGALVPDVLLTNPVVRLHVVYAASGEYVRQLQPAQLTTLELQQRQQQQGMPEAAESTGCTGTMITSCTGGLDESLATMQHVIETSVQDKMLENPARPTLTTVDNNTMHPKPALLQYIPPIQTKPYDLLQGQSNGLIAEWHEDLVLDVSLDVLAAADALLLLEILQLPSGFARFKHHAQDFGQGGAGHAVAWAFLRLNKLKQQQPDQPVELQLQLYTYSPAVLCTGGMLPRRLSGQQPNTPATAAFLSWKQYGLDDASSCCGGGAVMKETEGSLQNSSADATGQAAAAHVSLTAKSSSPSVMMWSMQQQSQFPGKALKRGEKYPGFLEVSVASPPRPAPEGLLVVTDPVAGVRPDVPAGYGSGFEYGRVPWGLLHRPKAGAAAFGPGAGAGMGGSGCGQAVLDQQLLLLEGRLHRPHTHACRVPNAVLVDIKGTAGGCSCIATSRDGRWLTAACADATGRFQIALYQALTGRLCCVLGTHQQMVYSLSWAKDDSCIISASADYTAKVWHLPLLPGPGLHKQQQHDFIGTATGFSQVHTAAAAAGGGGGGGSDAGVLCVVLQHKCFVYAAQIHPVQQPLQLALTAGYDGAVRLWTLDGQQVSWLQVSSSPLNCLALHQLGSRVYTGDATGCITEVAVDMAPVAACTSAAAAAWAAAAAAEEQSTGTCRPAAASASGQQCSPAQLLQPATPTSLAVTAAAAAMSDAVSPVAAVLRFGGSATQLLAGCNILKVLRTSTELAGGSITSLACHPGGHQLLALTKRSRYKGGVAKSSSSELVVLDIKLLLVARRMPNVRCGAAPVKFGISPDGVYVLCGSESATIWDIATGTSTPVPHMALGGAPVYSLCWNNCFHTVAACSFSPYAPIRVLCYAPDQPQVLLNPPQQGSAAAPAKQNKPQDAASGLRSRYVLPDHLTPHHVHALLADLRASAAQRGMCQQLGDPDGHHLVVRTHTNRRQQRGDGRTCTPPAAAAAAALQNGRLTTNHAQQAATHPRALGAGTCSAEGLELALKGHDGAVKCADSCLQELKNAKILRLSEQLHHVGASAAGGELGEASVLGDRNQQCSVEDSRVQQQLGRAPSKPCTPKVVVNRTGTADAVAAPWLQ